MNYMMDEEEGWKSLEVKAISCRDLKAFKLFQKLAVYAVVSILSDDDEEEDKQKRIKTGVDGEGGGNPEWNQVMQFDLRPYHHHNNKKVYFVKFKLRCGGVVFGKRSIGEVRVPLKDLMENFKFSGSTTARFLSYQVSTTDGKPNGVLNFSYTLKGNKAMRNKLQNTKSSSSSSSSLSSSNKNYKSYSLYPSLDDITSPSPAAAGFYYNSFPIRPVCSWYTT